MLIFDQLNKADKHLRALSWVVAFGLLVLLGGLWWIQIVRARQYAEDQRSQSYRTVRVPAPRGKILDRNGVPLAENRPTYNISLYLEDRSWRNAVQKHYKVTEAAARKTATAPRKPKAIEKLLSVFGYQPSPTQARRLNTGERARLGKDARYIVTSNIVWQLGEALGHSMALTNEAKFHQHYDRRRALPFPIIMNLNADQIARFQEQGTRLPGVDMEVQPTRLYPQGTLAAQVVGCLTHFDDTSAEGELASFNYHLADFKGYDGIESSFDSELRGKAGAKAVLVNNLGYRQSETVLSPIEPGKNVTLTIDAEIQRVAEQALNDAPLTRKPVRGAAVALDVATGEILALASVPAFDPNDWVPRLSPETWNSYTNDDIAPMRNRCVYGWYSPGSTFKTVVALAALDSGILDPSKIYHSLGYYPMGKGIGDTAPAGDYDFKRAFELSCNSYFIEYGLMVGPDALVAMGQRLHFGERTEIPLAQDSRGILPTHEWIKENRGTWRDGDTANLCIGQGDVAITPLQMAVAMAAVGNGGRVLWPQLVIGTQAQDELVDPANKPIVQPRLRDQLPVSKRTLEIIQQAMLGDTEDEHGTGRAANARHSGMRVCGKTGTAQVKKGGRVVDHITWFASYAPFEDARYSVVVMVQSGSSGGGTCAPIAAKIYSALKYREQGVPVPRKPTIVKK